jgi:hypothetical protein
VRDAVLAKHCDWRAEKLDEILKAAKFTGDQFL